MRTIAPASLAISTVRSVEALSNTWMRACGSAVWKSLIRGIANASLKQGISTGDVLPWPGISVLHVTFVLRRIGALQSGDCIIARAPPPGRAKEGDRLGSVEGSMDVAPGLAAAPGDVPGPRPVPCGPPRHLHGRGEPRLLAAQWLHRGHNPGAQAVPSKIFPILGSFYHGLQNAYLGLPFFAVAGFSVTSLRLEQAVFGLILLLALYHLSRRPHGVARAGRCRLRRPCHGTRIHRVVSYAVLHRAGWGGVVHPVDAAGTSRRDRVQDRTTPGLMVRYVSALQATAYSSFRSSAPPWPCLSRAGSSPRLGALGSGGPL